MLSGSNFGKLRRTIRIAQGCEHIVSSARECQRRFITDTSAGSCDQNECHRPLLAGIARNQCADYTLTECRPCDSSRATGSTLNVATARAQCFGRPTISLGQCTQQLIQDPGLTQTPLPRTPAPAADSSVYFVHWCSPSSECHPAAPLVAAASPPRGVPASPDSGLLGPAIPSAANTPWSARYRCGWKTPAPKAAVKLPSWLARPRRRSSDRRSPPPPPLRRARP